MDGFLVIVSRNRPDLYEQLLERHGAEAPVIFDRRQTPRPTTRASGMWHTHLERDGYMVVPTASRHPGRIPSSPSTQSPLAR